MTPDEFQLQEDFGRKIAQALTSLGLSATEIQRAAEFLEMDGDNAIILSTQLCRHRMSQATATWRKRGFARMAGVASYFET